MISRRKTFLSFALASLVLGAVAILSASRRSEIEMSIVKAQSVGHSHARDVRDLRKAVAVAEAMRDSYEKALAKYHAQPTRLPKTFHAPPSMQRVVVGDLRLQKLYLKAESARVARTYGPFLVTRQLSAEQITRFEGIFAEHIAERLDLVGEVRGTGDRVEGDMAAIAELVHQELDHFRLTLTEVLGDTGYREMQEYERFLPARELVDAFAGSIAFSEPIGASLSERMIEVLAHASTSYRAGREVDLDANSFDEAQRQLSPLLSTSQLKAWREVTEIPRYQHIFGSELSRAAAESQR